MGFDLKKFFRIGEDRSNVPDSQNDSVLPPLDSETTKTPEQKRGPLFQERFNEFKEVVGSFLKAKNSWGDTPEVKEIRSNVMELIKKIYVADNKRLSGGLLFDLKIAKSDAEAGESNAEISGILNQIRIIISKQEEASGVTKPLPKAEERSPQAPETEWTEQEINKQRKLLKQRAKQLEERIEQLDDNETLNSLTKDLDSTVMNFFLYEFVKAKTTKESIALLEKVSENIVRIESAVKIAEEAPNTAPLLQGNEPSPQAPETVWTKAKIDQEIISLRMEVIKLEVLVKGLTISDNIGFINSNLDKFKNTFLYGLPPNNQFASVFFKEASRDLAKIELYIKQAQKCEKEKNPVEGAVFIDSKDAVSKETPTPNPKPNPEPTQSAPTVKKIPKTPDLKPNKKLNPEQINQQIVDLKNRFNLLGNKIEKITNNNTEQERLRRLLNRIPKHIGEAEEQYKKDQNLDDLTNRLQEINTAFAKIEAKLPAQVQPDPEPKPKPKESAQPPVVKPDLEEIPTIIDGLLKTYNALQSILENDLKNLSADQKNEFKVRLFEAIKPIDKKHVKGEIDEPMVKESAGLLAEIKKDIEVIKEAQAIQGRIDTIRETKEQLSASITQLTSEQQKEVFEKNLKLIDSGLGDLVNNPKYDPMDYLKTLEKLIKTTQDQLQKSLEKEAREKEAREMQAREMQAWEKEVREIEALETAKKVKLTDDREAALNKFNLLKLDYDWMKDLTNQEIITDDSPEANEFKGLLNQSRDFSEFIKSKKGPVTYSKEVTNSDAANLCRVIEGIDQQIKMNQFEIKAQGGQIFIRKKKKPTIDKIFEN